MVDRSSSNLQSITAFLSDLVGQLRIGQSEFLVAVVGYGTSSQMVLSFRDSTDANRVRQGISSIQPEFTQTSNLGAALQYVRQTVFSSSNGHREDALNLLLVVTDKQASDVGVVENMRWEMVVGAPYVAIASIDIGFFRNLRLSAIDRYYFQASSAAALSSMRDQVLQDFIYDFRCKALKYVFTV